LLCQALNTSSTVAELEVIEKAMSIRTNSETVIFTNSQAVMTRLIKHSDKRKNENTTIKGQMPK
jgi:hypothetical protein